MQCIYQSNSAYISALQSTKLSLQRLPSYLRYRSVFTRTFIIILSAYRSTLSHPTTLSSSILSPEKENENEKKEEEEEEDEHDKEQEEENEEKEKEK